MITSWLVMVMVLLISSTNIWIMNHFIFFEFGMKTNANSDFSENTLRKSHIIKLLLWIENIENGNEWGIAVGVAAKSPNQIRFMIMIIMMANIKWIWWRCDAGAVAGAGEIFKFLEQIVATFRLKVVKYKTQWISVRINFRFIHCEVEPSTD